ncbi:DUF554 domain-containing protein [Anaerotignum sp.]|uniref:DUF554 domain-containing protein n=1 Tax=Anaerotignum sp. TaxID=2039241 RepID=UPI0037354C2F
MIPRGVILDCCCVLLGTNCGTLLRNKIPGRLQEPLMVIFGMCAIAIGIVSVVKLESLPAVLLALILGTIIGELIDLDRKIKNGFLHGLRHCNFKIEGDREAYMRFYLVVVVTLCASGTNIFGAFQEGATGDMTILMSKAVMDIFAAAIFAMALGFGMNLIVVPQFLILSLCFYGGRFGMAYLNPSAIQNFIAVGGLMTFILGLNIAKIKEVRAANMLPALVLVFPATALFQLMGA